MKTLPLKGHSSSWFYILCSMPYVFSVKEGDKLGDTGTSTNFSLSLKLLLIFQLPVLKQISDRSLLGSKCTMSTRRVTARPKAAGCGAGEGVCHGAGFTGKSIRITNATPETRNAPMSQADAFQSNFKAHYELGKLYKYLEVFHNPIQKASWVELPQL